MEPSAYHELTTLRVPGELANLVARVDLPVDLSNPLVVCEFKMGGSSLFDVQKGLFLRKPPGLQFPSRETLKAFGRLIQSFRMGQRQEGGTMPEGAPVECFAVFG